MKTRALTSPACSPSLAVVIAVGGLALFVLGDRDEPVPVQAEEPIVVVLPDAAPDLLLVEEAPDLTALAVAPDLSPDLSAAWIVEITPESAEAYGSILARDAHMTTAPRRPGALRARDR